MACATPKFSGTGGKGGPQKDFAGRLVVFFLSANLTATHASKLWPRGSRVRVWLQDLLLTMGRKRLAEARKVASQHRAAMARKGLLALERQAQLKAQNGADAGADLGSTVSHSRFVSFSRFFFFYLVSFIIVDPPIVEQFLSYLVVVRLKPLQFLETGFGVYLLLNNDYGHLFSRKFFAGQVNICNF